MSISDSTVSVIKSGLAKSYATFSTNKSPMGKKKACHQSSYIFTVESKIKAAEKKYGYTLKEASGYINTGYGGASMNTDPATEACGYDLLGSIPQSQDQKKMRELANHLIDPEHMWKHYFSGILDDCAQAVEKNVEETDLDLVTSTERNHSKMRMDHRAATACYLPIKLILTQLHRRGRKLAEAFAPLLEMQFGPLHASLQVGDIVVEWNNNSLVIPHLCDHKDRIFQVHIEQHSKWIDYVRDVKISTASAAESGPVDQTEQIFVIAEKKKEIIDALIEIIVKFNKSCFYNIINHNCQHFVMDCLTALGVKLPDVLATGGLREYYNQVVAGRTPNIPKKFETHSDLNKYVETKDLTSMPQHDLEFILLIYFQFHSESKEAHAKASRPLNEWKCQESSCLMEEVEELVEFQSLLIHKFASGK